MRKFAKVTRGNRNLKAGFTIIETVVALGVFAIAVVEITATFYAVLRLDEKSRAVRLVEQNARFISEFITREVRNGVLNYSTAPGAYSAGAIPATGSDLRLINSAGEHILINPSGTSLRLTKYGIGAGGSDVSTNLSGDKVQISNLIFFITPSQDPSVSHLHPRVTFTFTVTSNTNSRTLDQSSMKIQGTATTRDY